MIRNQFLIYGRQTAHGCDVSKKPRRSFLFLSFFAVAIFLLPMAGAAQISSGSETVLACVSPHRHIAGYGWISKTKLVFSLAGCDSEETPSGVSLSHVVIFDRSTFAWKIAKVEVPGRDSRLTTSRSGALAIATEIEADVFDDSLSAPIKISLPEDTKHFALLDEKNLAYLQIQDHQDHGVHVLFIRFPEIETVYSAAIAPADWQNGPVSVGGVIFVRSRQTCTFGKMALNSTISFVELYAGHHRCMTVLGNLEDGNIVAADRSRLFIIDRSGKKEQIAQERGLRWDEIKDRTANQGIVAGTYTGWFQVLWRKCLHRATRSQYLIDFRPTSKSPKVAIFSSDKVAISEGGKHVAAFEMNQDSVCIENLELGQSGSSSTVARVENKCLSFAPLR